MKRLSQGAGVDSRENPTFKTEKRNCLKRARKALSDSFVLKFLERSFLRRTFHFFHKFEKFSM